MTKSEYKKLYLEKKKLNIKIENTEKNNNSISRDRIERRPIAEKYQKKRKYIEVESNGWQSEPEYEEENESKDEERAKKKWRKTKKNQKWREKRINQK